MTYYKCIKPPGQGRKEAANPGSGPGQGPESRIPGINRGPAFEMVPDFRRDGVWTPAFAGVTLQKTFYETVNLLVPLFSGAMGEGGGRRKNRHIPQI